MTDMPEELADRQVRFLYELACWNTPIAGDVVKVSDDTWAIYGVLPVDGDEILAEFPSYAQARLVLDQLPIGSQTCTGSSWRWSEPEAG